MSNPFTHILLGVDEIAFFINEHDPQKVHLNAYLFLVEDFAPNCAKEIYADDWVQLFQITTEYHISR